MPDTNLTSVQPSCPVFAAFDFNNRTVTKKRNLLTLFLFITEENIVGAHVWWKSCQNLPQNINHFMAPGKPQRIPVSLYLSQRLMSVYVCVCFPCVPVCWQKCSLLISISLTASETEHFLLVLFESLDTRSQLSSVLVPFPEEVPSAAPINFLPFYFLATRGQRPHLPDKLLVHPLQVGKVNWNWWSANFHLCHLGVGTAQTFNFYFGILRHFLPCLNIIH